MASTLLLRRYRPRMQRAIAGFWNDSRGIVGLEFAVTAIPLFMMIFAIFEVGFILKSQNDLDLATQAASRQIMTGAVQNAKTALTAAQFRTQFLCPKLPSSYSCEKVIVNATTFDDPAVAGNGFYAFVYGSPPSGLILQTTESSYNLGSSGAYVYLQVAYPLPALTAILGTGGFTKFNGSWVNMLVSSAAFRNEPFQTN